MSEVPPREKRKSHLECVFQRLLVGRLRRSGATVSEVPGPTGNVVRFTLPGTHRQWTLTPQVNIKDARPDFLLETNDINVPAVAIFTDGRAYHAIRSANRLADDARKRAHLRDSRLVVLGITIHDVRTDDDPPVAPPAWYRPDVSGRLMDVKELQAPPEAYRALARGPIDWLVDWVSAPQPQAVRNVARAVPVLLMPSTQPVLVTEAVALEEVAKAALLDVPLPEGPRRVQLHRTKALAVVVEMLPTKVVQVAVVLDDRDESLDDAHAEAWRTWLRLSNALALRDWPTVVTTTSLVASTTPPGPGRLLGAWADAYDAAAPGEERKLIATLAAYDGLAPPVVGAEGPDGIPLDLSWPWSRIAVAFDHMPAQDRADLEAAGWRVVTPSPKLIAAVLSDPREGAH